MNITQLLSTALLYAGLIIYMVSVVRAAPLIPDAWKRQKPISCNTCMVIWTGMAALTPLMFSAQGRPGWLAAIITALASEGFAVVGLALVSWTPPEPGPLNTFTRICGPGCDAEGPHERCFKDGRWLDDGTEM